MVLITFVRVQSFVFVKDAMLVQAGTELLLGGASERVLQKRLEMQKIFVAKNWNNHVAQDLEELYLDNVYMNVRYFQAYKI